MIKEPKILVSTIAITRYPPFLVLIGIDEKASNARGRGPPNNRAPLLPSTDLAEEITGIYRLLDIISESGSNGCGNKHHPDVLPVG